MTNDPHPSRVAILQLQVSKFWSDDIGLTLITIATAALVFVINPLREAGLPGRIFFDLMMAVLMISGSLSASRSRIIEAPSYSFRAALSAQCAERPAVSHGAAPPSSTIEDARHCLSSTNQFQGRERATLIPRTSCGYLPETAV